MIFVSFIMINYGIGKIYNSAIKAMNKINLEKYFKKALESRLYDDFHKIKRNDLRK